MQHHAEILLEDTNETQALNIIQEQIKENPLLKYERKRLFTPVWF